MTLDEDNTTIFNAFLDKTLIARGALEAVVTTAKGHLDQGKTERLAILNDATSEPLEVDFRGELAEILGRLAHHPDIKASQPREETGPRRPGRPKLGVVSREVSLLPRHWDWLGQQPGGASGTLRRLVEEASKKNAGEDRRREAENAVHRFMWDMAGNEPNFEEATRAFYARDYQTMVGLMKDWPTDVRVHIKRLVQRLLPETSLS